MGKLLQRMSDASRSGVYRVTRDREVLDTLPAIPRISFAGVKTKAELLERIKVLESGEPEPPRVSATTLAAMPGGAPAADKGETHTVNLNGVAYVWTDGDEGSVFEEAVAVYRRMRAANP